MSDSAVIEIPETPAIKAALANLLAEIRKAKQVTEIRSGTFAQHKASRAAANRLGVALIRLLEEQAPVIAEQVATAYAKAMGKEG